MTFYDMDLNKIAQKINFPIKILENAEASINNYVNECFNILSDYYDSLLVALLLNEIERNLFNTDFGDNESINLKVNQTFIYFAYLKLLNQYLKITKLSGKILSEKRLSLKTIPASCILRNGTLRILSTNWRSSIQKLPM